MGRHGLFFWIAALAAVTNLGFVLWALFVAWCRDHTHVSLTMLAAMVFWLATGVEGILVRASVIPFIHLGLYGAMLMIIIISIALSRDTSQRLALLDFALDNVREAAFLSDPGGRLRYVNAEACRVLGYSRGELTGRPVADIDPDFVPERWRAHWEELRRKGSLVFQSRHHCRDGRSLPVEINANYFTFAGRSYNLSMARDISMRIRAEEAVEKERQRFDAQQKQALDTLREREQTISPRLLQVNETVEGMLKMLQRLIGEAVEIEWLPGEEIWPLRMDPSQFDQILANMCVNSRDAIDGVGAITIGTHNVSMDERDCAAYPEVSPGRYVLLEVNDNGCGMDHATLSKIFEPFFTTKDQGKGTGLGLPMVYGIVKQNNGLLNVYSEPGKGTTFKIYLPAHPSAQRAAAESIRPDPLPRGTETILLVEDAPPILNLVNRMLENFGYNAVPASSPTEAIRLAAEHPGKIDLLLTDVVMPGMNGRDLAKKIGAARPGLKCLFMSGYMGGVVAELGILEAGTHFIQKPFSVQTLATKLREALGSE